MCHGCWTEAGSPQIENEKVRAAVALITEVYRGHAAGGGLHIALDDYNLDHESIAWLDIHFGEYTDPANLEVERSCLDALKALTETERYAAVGAYHGDWLPGGMLEMGWIAKLAAQDVEHAKQLERLTKADVEIHRLISAVAAASTPPAVPAGGVQILVRGPGTMQ